MQRAPQSDIIEVRGPDGSFQQGTLVDCAPGGLMIDWECQGEPASLFVPFGEMYLNRRRGLCEQDTKEVHQGKELPVEVLVRRSPKDPKTWYPGVLFTAEFNSSNIFGLVKANLPDGVAIIVAPGQRIRVPRSDAGLEILRVKTGHFVKETVRLPKEFACEGSAKEVLDALNRTNREFKHSVDRVRTFIRAVEIDDKWLHYIRIGYNILHKDLQNQTPAKWATLLTDAASDCAKARKQQRKRQQSASDRQSMTPHTIPNPAYGIQLLPKHIIGCVFTHLDSVDQSRLRRVCAYWNGILTSPRVARVARVRYANKKQDYLSVASLHHAWTSDTKFIINAGVHVGPHPLFCGGRLFRTLVRKGLHVPVPTVIFADAVWTLETRSCFADSVVRFVEELNDITVACRTLVLHNVKVTASPVDKFIFPEVRLSGSLTVEDLWCWIDGSLPSVAETQAKVLSDWIGFSGQWREHDQREIVKILNDRQSSDPRKDAHYRGREWTVANVADLDLRRLSKLTLHSLVALRNGASTRILFLGSTKNVQALGCGHR